MQTESRIPEGVWQKCPGCGELLFIRDLIRNLKICNKCGVHFPMDAEEYLEMLCSKTSFSRVDAPLDPASSIFGIGKIRKIEAFWAIMDSGVKKSPREQVFRAMTVAFESSLERSLPLVSIVPGGIIIPSESKSEVLDSYLLMEKAAIEFDRAKLPSILVLTLPDPEYGFATSIPAGDFILAEPTGRTDLREKIDPTKLYSTPAPDRLIDDIVARDELEGRIWTILRWSRR